MVRSKIISLIDKAITNRKGEVMYALQESGVVAPVGISDEDYRNIIIREIENGNGYLVVYLGSVIDKDIKPKPEKKSNVVGLLGATLIGTGGNLLSTLTGGLFASKRAKAERKSAEKQQQAALAYQSQQQKILEKQMKIAASQQAANEMLAQADRENSKSRTQRTMVTLSIIGGTLLIGAVTAILIIKKK